MKAKRLSVSVAGIEPGTEGYFILPDGRKLKLKDISGHMTLTLKRATEVPDWVKGQLEFKTCPTSK